MVLSYDQEEGKLVGTYDVGEELDSYHSKIIDKQTGHTFEFESGSITIAKDETGKLYVSCVAEAMYYDDATEQVTRNSYVIDFEYTPEATGVENMVLTEKSQKVVVDGQVYVIRDNKMYNVLGTQVR